MDNGWDWNKMLASWDYHTLSLDNWLGWEKADNNEPYYLNLKFTYGEENSSRNWAVQWDDLAQGNFWYRDYTESGTPFLEKNDTYESIFAFQFKADYDKFKEAFKL